jgi:hypothetical protein
MIELQSGSIPDSPPVLNVVRRGCAPESARIEHAIRRIACQPQHIMPSSILPAVLAVP